MRRAPSGHGIRGLRGFTLIELLVAISLLAVMAVMSWRGLDGMVRTQAQTRQHTDEVLALQAALGQWGADLDALVQLPDAPGLDWDGRALRVLRRSSSAPGDGLLVVAWARRLQEGQGQWLRWQSPPLRTQRELLQAWQKAGSWAQNPGDEDRQREVLVMPVDQWQIFYFRSDAWSNPLSSDGTPSTSQVAGAPQTPDGVRLVLTLPQGQAISGNITRDWVRPEIGGGK